MRAETINSHQLYGKEKRSRDPFWDRRSGEDRRNRYCLKYFEANKLDRRRDRERRYVKERRSDCIRVSIWSSVCPDYSEKAYRDGQVKLASNDTKENTTLDEQ